MKSVRSLLLGLRQASTKALPHPWQRAIETLNRVRLTDSPHLLVAAIGSSMRVVEIAASQRLLELDDVGSRLEWLQRWISMQVCSNGEAANRLRER